MVAALPENVQDTKDYASISQAKPALKGILLNVLYLMGLAWNASATNGEE
jgi:hypothetical protein